MPKVFPFSLKQKADFNILILALFIMSSSWLPFAAVVGVLRPQRSLKPLAGITSAVWGHIELHGATRGHNLHRVPLSFSGMIHWIFDCCYNVKSQLVPESSLVTLTV